MTTTFESGRRLLGAGRLLVLFGFAILLACQNSGQPNQTSLGVIQGTVRIAASGSRQGILVQARGQGRNYQTSVFTDAHGRYEFPPLPSGVYTISTGSQLREFVSLSGSGVRLDFTVVPGPDFMQQTSGSSWAAVLPLTEAEKGTLNKSCGSSCHTLWRPMGSEAHSAEEWAEIVRGKASIGPSGRPLDPGDPPRLDVSPQNVQAVSALLAKVVRPEVKAAVGEQAMFRPAGEAARAIFTEWDLPVRDRLSTSWVWADSEGFIWYTVPGGDHVGRLDWRSGQFQEWSYPADGVLFHDLVGDGQGNLWLPLADGDRIVRFNSETFEFTDWEIPGKSGRRPHLGDVDPDGNFWVTLNRPVNGVEGVAKLDPRTGEITEYPTLTRGSRPYDLDVTADGTVWFTESRANKIGRIDAAENLTEYDIPTTAAEPRGIGVDSGGRVWFTEYSADQLGVLNPATGEFKEYEIGVPGGRPEVLKVGPDDKVWFALLNGNLLAKFDPASEEFTLFLLPTPESIVRGLSFDDSTDPVSVVYGAGRKGKIGRITFR